MQDGFDASALRRGYRFLDKCPERFVEAAITLPFGDLAGRVQGICAWRTALLDGRLPDRDAWLGGQIAAPARQALADMKIARICRDCPELVDDLLVDILASFARNNEVVQADIAERLCELAAAELAQAAELYELERPPLSVAAWLWPPSTPRPLPECEVNLSEEELGRLTDQAAREIGGRARAADRGLLDSWEEQAQAWGEIADVLDDLGPMLGGSGTLSMDLTLGMLRHVGWCKLVELQQLVKRLPEFRKIIQALGQLHVSKTDRTVAGQVFVPMRRSNGQGQETVPPVMHEETRGVERSDAIARMLPVEATMLGHPKLRLLWHARRSEQTLLTYRVEGVDLDKREAERNEDIREPRRQRGPILAIVDTSGSMGGNPEQIAKALVLEALRTAHAERRRCLLYTFSGPGQIAEHELALSAQGVGELLDFLGLTFGGGSDPARAIEEVLGKVRANEWQEADVLLVSDGEWLVPPELIAGVRQALRTGTSFHGVQIGKRGRTGLHDICEPVHVFSSWRDISDDWA